MKVKSESEVTQSCPTLSDPMDWSLPGSSVHGIFQARVLEWGAIAFSLTNLDSILKSRGIILPTKVHLVKATAFPVVMYGCESWAIKKGEHRRIDSFLWLSSIALEKAMAPHSSTLAWKTPWTEEPGGLQSMGSLRVGHD